MSIRSRGFLLLFVGAVLVFSACDQGTKRLAQDHLSEPIDGSVHHRRTVDVDIIDGAFALSYAENPAAAFSFLRSAPAAIRRPVLIVVPSAFLVLVVVLAWRRRRELPLYTHAALALVAGGALGNLIDRVRLGYVVDFLKVHAGFINEAWPPFPIFNVADACVVIGGALMLVSIARHHDPEKPDEGGFQPASARS